MGIKFLDGGFCFYGINNEPHQEYNLKYRGVRADITYQAIAGIRWQFSKVVSAKLAYRYLHKDFEEDDFKWGGS